MPKLCALEKVRELQERGTAFISKHPEVDLNKFFQVLGCSFLALCQQHE